MTRHFSRGSNQTGFTIVELMIATAVLSVLLLLATVLITRIGNVYYKGINQARIQNDARLITNQVAQDIELTNALPTQGSASLTGGVTAQVLCVGNTRYTYILNAAINQPFGGPGGPIIYHILWRDTPTGGCSATAPADLELANPSTGGEEFISPNSRLTALTVSSPPSPYAVSVGVAYGADDLLSGSGINTTCQSTTGNQFCATASLSTTVDQRL